LDLLRGEPRRVGEALCRLDVVSVAVDHRELIGMPMKDRRLVPTPLAGRDLAAPVERERPEQDGGEMRTPAKQLGVERDRADDAAQAAGLRGLQAQQPDDIDRVGMESLLVRRLVDARGRIVDAAAEVLHVTQDMTLAVLRHRLAEICTDAEEGG